MTVLLWTLLVLALPGLLLGLITWALYPLSLLFELRQKTQGVLPESVPVSVVIPAWNESVVLAGCIESVLASGYAQLQVVLVDDGSTDDTLSIMRSYERDPRVIVVAKPNGGKGSALNAGIAVATGDVLIFVDADGLFTQHTIPEMLRGFRHEQVGAVCGNDVPVNVTGPLTGLLALMTHVGTGLTRRALALVGMLPIVAGNSGAFRADVLHRLGGFREDTVGEDLELTWRVQFLGFDVEFAPRALVLAEVPSTLTGLWKQRVRWQRGLIQTARVHRERLMTSPRRPVDLYLPANLAAMLLLPVLQLLAWPLAIAAVATGQIQITGPIAVLLWTGLGVSLGVTVLALALDRSWRDIRLLVLLPLWLPFSIMMSLVTVRALHQELTGASASWNKLERTGVRNVTVSTSSTG